MTTGLYFLRCKQLNLTVEDLDSITYGMVLDLFCENMNDDYNYRTLATQSDFDRF